MGLFYNYETAGKGVSKNGPKKKPFFKFWEIFGGKFWKLMQVNLIYLLFCLPVVTFGPATASMFQIMRKFYTEKSIFVFSEYWKCFKKNFKQSFIVGIFDIAFMALVVFAINYYDKMVATTAGDNYLYFILLGVTVGICVFALIAHYYIYLQIVTLNLGLGAIVKNSLILTIAGLKKNIIAVIVTAVFAVLIWLFFPFSTLVLPFMPFAWLAFLATFNAYPIIQKHIINPYYEARGEKNPELPEEDEASGENIFVDRGGSEAEIKKVQTKGIGRIIK